MKPWATGGGPFAKLTFALAPVRSSPWWRRWGRAWSRHDAGQRRHRCITARLYPRAKKRLARCQHTAGMERWRKDGLGWPTYAAGPEKSLSQRRTLGGVKGGMADKPSPPRIRPAAPPSGLSSRPLPGEPVGSRKGGCRSIKRDLATGLEPPPLDAHPFEARCKLFVLVRELYELAALIGTARNSAEFLASPARLR
jgi:hypothetical protein